MNYCFSPIAFGPQGISTPPCPLPPLSRPGLSRCLLLLRSPCQCGRVVSCQRCYYCMRADCSQAESCKKILNRSDHSLDQRRWSNCGPLNQYYKWYQTFWPFQTRLGLTSVGIKQIKTKKILYCFCVWTAFERPFMAFETSSESSLSVGNKKILIGLAAAGQDE